MLTVGVEIMIPSLWFTHNMILFFYSSCRSHYDEIICECPDDMDLDEDMRTCITSDPCHTENGGCSHFCDSSLKYICYCPEVGYVLDEDSKTCREVFKCEHGFELSMHDNRTCIDIDECSKDPGICLNGKCENKEGSYQCHCHSGYRLSDDVKTCIDFDECSQEVSPCSHRCSNLPGSYQCGCPYGQILIDDHTCGFSDLCDFNNGGCGKLKLHSYFMSFLFFFYLLFSTFFFFFFGFISLQ